MARYSFITGETYSFIFPDEKEGTEGYDPEDLYDAYWNDELPEDVEVEENGVDHEWTN
jgi:hypothetical protein